LVQKLEDVFIGFPPSQRPIWFMILNLHSHKIFISQVFYKSNLESCRNKALSKDQISHLYCISCMLEWWSYNCCI